MRYPFTEKLPELLKKFADTLSTCHSSTNVQEALTDPKWTQAIQEEMEALVNNKTQNRVPLPKGKKTVGYKWVFSIKHKADGSVE